jgi:NADH oxidase (H2O2-forming)
MNDSEIHIKKPQSQNPKVIIIGSGVAGMNLINHLIRSEKSFDITCITQEQICDYSTCGIPYVLDGEVRSFEDLILHKPDYFNDNNVKLLKNTKVISINIENNSLILADQSKTDEYQKYELAFDILVLATGRAPVTPPIDGLDLKGVHTLMNYSDGEELFIAKEDKHNGVIIGAGIIGLEVASAFNNIGMKTTVVELAPNVLPAILDEDMAHIVDEWLSEKGIEIITGTAVEKVLGKDSVEFVKLNNNEELKADIVLLSAGVKPNSTLAAQCGLDIGDLGGIITDKTQRTLRHGSSINNVFALGDCVESKNFITNDPMISALASTALLQSRVIVENIHNRYSEMNGVLNPTVTQVAGLQIGSVGLTSYFAKKAGIEFKTAKSSGKSHSRYYPGWREIYFKFIVSDGKLIGAQIVGEKDVKERINLLALAIHARVELKTLYNLERCYTPPLSLLTDPMHKALKQLI